MDGLRPKRTTMLNRHLEKFANIVSYETQSPSQPGLSNYLLLSNSHLLTLVSYHVRKAESIWIEADEMKVTKIRYLGAPERYMTTRSELGIYNNVAVTVQYNRQKVEDLKPELFRALAFVIQRHPSLSAVPLDMDKPEPYFVKLSHVDLDQVVEFVDASPHAGFSGTNRQHWLDRFLQEQHNQPFEHTVPPSPFWRLYVFEDTLDRSSFTLALFFHHCITDTKGALVVLEDIEAALNTDIKSIPSPIVSSSDLALPPPLDQFREYIHKSDQKPKQAVRLGQWTGANQSLPEKSKFRSYYLPQEETSQLLLVTKQAHFTLTAVLQTLFATAIFRCLPGGYDVLRVDCPLSLRPWIPLQSIDRCMGCYIDNFPTVYSRGSFSWAEVKRTQEIINHIVQQRGGDDLCGLVTRITDLRSWFNEKMGHARPGALELSNVGKLPELRHSGKYEMQSLLFSQSASACSGALKVSAATGRDGRLTLGFSWQEGVLEDDMVDSIISNLDSVVSQVLDDTEPNGT